MTDPVSTDVNINGTDATNSSASGAPIVSQEAADSLMQALTALISSSSTPEIRQAQVLLLQRLALEGSVIPSRIPAPANITQVGGYINLLTALGQEDMRAQMLGSALGLAGSVPLPGLNDTPPPLTITPIANDQPAGSTGITRSVVMRSDLAAILAGALDTIHAAGGMLPLWAPAALPPAGASTLQDLLLYLGRAVLVAPTATMMDPQADAVVLGRPVADAGNGFRVAVRVDAGTSGGDARDWTCLRWDDVSGGFTEQTVSGATLLPLDTALAGSGLTPPVPIATVPADRADLAWAQIAALGGLLPGTTRLGDELALVYPQTQITASALAPRVDWTWEGTRFAPV